MPRAAARLDREAGWRRRDESGADAAPAAESRAPPARLHRAEAARVDAAPAPVFNAKDAAGDAAVAATPAGKRAKTGGLSDDVGGSFAVPSTPKGAGVAGITRINAGGPKIAVAQTPGTKRRVKRGEMLYSANGSPLGAVDGERPMKSPPSSAPRRRRRR